MPTVNPHAQAIVLRLTGEPLKAVQVTLNNRKEYESIRSSLARSRLNGIDYGTIDEDWQLRTSWNNETKCALFWFESLEEKIKNSGINIIEDGVEKPLIRTKSEIKLEGEIQALMDSMKQFDPDFKREDAIKMIEASNKVRAGEINNTTDGGLTVPDAE